MNTQHSFRDMFPMHLLSYLFPALFYKKKPNPPTVIHFQHKIAGVVTHSKVGESITTWLNLIQDPKTINVNLSLTSRPVPFESCHI